MSLNRIQDNKKYGGGQYGVVYTKPEVVKFILDEVGYCLRPIFLPLR